MMQIELTDDIKKKFIFMFYRNNLFEIIFKRFLPRNIKFTMT
jgi:hypothetical protein